MILFAKHLIVRAYLNDFVSVSAQGSSINILNFCRSTAFIYFPASNYADICLSITKLIFMGICVKLDWFFFSLIRMLVWMHVSLVALPCQVAWVSNYVPSIITV